jgi:hypothetical protein
VEHHLFCSFGQRHCFKNLRLLLLLLLRAFLLLRQQFTVMLSVMLPDEVVKLHEAGGFQRSAFGGQKGQMLNAVSRATRRVAPTPAYHESAGDGGRYGWLNRQLLLENSLLVVTGDDESNKKGFCAEAVIVHL